MRSRSVSGVVLEGHKGCAVEVPFDPAEVWGVSAVAIRPGRRGFPVVARAKRQSFESWIVARSRRHWLLLEPAQLMALGVAAGETLAFTVSPAPGDV